MSLPSPILHLNPLTRRSLPQRKLLHRKEQLLLRTACMNGHLGKYFSRRICAAIEYGLVRILQHCLAKSAWLKDTSSLKPTPPLSLEEYNLFHAIQCFLSLPFCFSHQKEEVKSFISSQRLLGNLKMLIVKVGTACTTALINPFGQVPVLEDGDLTLFESRAITQYISHTYTDNKGTPLITPDPKKMAILSVWTEVETQKFDPQAHKLAQELVIKPILGRTTDQAIVTEHEGKLAEVLDIYEARLTQSKYLGGDSFTLADLHHLPVINYLMGSKIKALFDAHPHLSAWCTDILARPTWKKVVALMKH